MVRLQYVRSCNGWDVRYTGVTHLVDYVRVSLNAPRHWHCLPTRAWRFCAIWACGFRRCVLYESPLLYKYLSCTLSCRVYAAAFEF